MKLSLQKALSFVLVFVMVLGIVPFSAFADETQQVSESIATMEGLNISYPYNTETVKQTGSVPSRFSALTFESARNEVESAQMILSPNFNVTSFQLTMGSLKNENGNIIPSWAFEVFVQHYVSISGAGNAPYWTKDKSGTYMFKPRGGEAGKGASGMFPDALIPMDAAITAGENKISAGKNGGLWVNLDVQDAAPGTYTGFATLNVNGTDMQIPVSVHIYDVSVPEEVHVESMFPIWWDQLQAAEGIDRNLADAYFDYLVSKRVMPMDAWNITRWDDAFVDYAASYLAVAPEISSYSLHFERNSDGTINETALTNTLTAIIDKNIELAQSGSDADLFKKAYFAFYDEPENSSEYRDANAMTAQLDKVKNALASKLDAYPELKASFMSLKTIVTAQHPDDATYDKMWQDVGSTKLTGSYIYCPQFQYMNTAAQRAYYANEETVWWYGCCFPTEPFPTYHINSPLIAARATGWMMYDYDIDGMLYSAVNYWGKYNNDGSITQLSYWTGYTDNGTPGDGMLVYPGSDYGVYGPIGTIRLENIREGNEDYEYLWLLGEEYGQDVSTYTKGLYEGVIVTGVYDGQTIDPDGDGNTDAVTIHYNNRKAMLTKLEQLNVAANGETEITPGQEGFVRGELLDTSSSVTIQIDETIEAQAVTFDYKYVSGSKFGFVLMQDWSNWYGYFDFNGNGTTNTYDGVTCVPLDDGYFRVVIDLNKVSEIEANPGRNLDFIYFSNRRGTASFYLDNLQVLTEVPEIEIPTEPPVTEPPVTEPPATEPPQQVFEGGSFTTGGGLTIGLDNDQPVTTMSFDYQITSGSSFTIAFLPGDWSNFYGNFTLTANGANYDGLMVQPLGNGYMRVFVEFGKVTHFAGTPTSTVINTIYLRGQNCSADGQITNIRLNDSSETPVPGTYFPAETTTSFYFEEGNYETVSFEYKIISGEKFAICMGNSGLTKFYGYYNFNAAGSTSSYEGVTTEVLENGYIRVTFILADLQVTNSHSNRDNVPETVSRLYIRGNWSDAAGFLGNITYTLPCSHSYDEVITTPTFEANGYTTYTCTLCGDSYVGDETAPYSFNIPAWNIALCDDICATFHLNIDSRLTDATVTVLADGNDCCYNLSELSTTEEGYYVVSTNVAAAQMTDEITIQVVSGKNASEVKSYSIRGYAEYILKNSDDENTKLLVQRMLNYGAAAQNYFAYNMDNLANTGYEMTDAPEIPEAESGSVASGDVVGIDYYGASLLYETRVGVRFYFTVTGRIENYTFTDAAGNSYEPVSKSGLYYVEVMNITPNAYDDVIEMFVTDGANTLTVGYSPLRYISRKYYGSDAKLSALVGAMYQYHKAAELYLGENNDMPENVFEGGAFAPESGASIVIDNDQVVTRMTFDYKIESGEYFHIALISEDWNNFFGYFKFYATGAANSYDGVVTREMADGSIRVYMDMTAVTTIAGTSPSDVVRLLYIRGSWTTANGTISNICINEAAEIAPRGQLLTQSVGKNFELKNNGVLNSEELTTVSFEYKIVDGEKFAVALMPDWSSYYGYYNFNASGALSANSGVTTEVLEDGYIRVTFDIAALDSIAGTPTSVITMLYFRGGYCNADVYIDNIQYEVAEPVVRGEAFKAGTQYYYYTECTDNMSQFSFDYKITNDGFMDIYIGNDNGRYGNYYLYADGEQTDYDGITTEVLEDGYIRVTFQLDVLSGSTGASITYLRLRATTTATGFVDNMQWIAVRGTKFNAGANSYVYTDCADALSQFVFEYRVTNDGVMDVLVGNDNGQYGNFYFDSNGTVTSLTDKTAKNYDGVSVEVLDDGYIRVTMQLDELTTVYRGTPGNVIAYIRVRATTTAKGFLDNLQLNV